MEGKNLAKLCRDCGLLSKSLTTIDVDIIFAKVRPYAARPMGLTCSEALAEAVLAQVKAKGSRKISFSEFLNAVDSLAQKKVWSKRGRIGSQDCTPANPDSI